MQYDNRFATGLRPGDLMLWIEWDYMMREGITPSPERSRQTARAFGRLIAIRDAELIYRLGE